MRKNSSGSARISVLPPPALHCRADHHPAHRRPHVVQLSVQHDVSIRAEDVAALTDLSVHWSVVTLDHVHSKPHRLFFPLMEILSVPHKSILLMLFRLLQSSQMLLAASVSTKMTLSKVFTFGVSLAKGRRCQRWGRKHHHLSLFVHLGAGTPPPPFCIHPSLPIYV